MTLNELCELMADYGDDLTVREALRRRDEAAWQAEMSVRDRRADALAAEKVRARQDLEDRLSDARVALRARGAAAVRS